MGDHYTRDLTLTNAVLSKQFHKNLFLPSDQIFEGLLDGVKQLSPEADVVCDKM